MWDFSFICLIGLQILGAVVALSSTDGIFRKKIPGQIFQPSNQFLVTKKGIALIIVFLLIIGISIAKEMIDNSAKETLAKKNKEELEANERLSEQLQFSRDTAAAGRLERSKNETIDALARYGLKYDSAQNVIIRLVSDSKKTTIISKEKTLVQFCADNAIMSKDTSGDRTSITVRVCNTGGVTTHVKFKIYLFYAGDVGIDSFVNVGYIGTLNPKAVEFSLGNPEYREFYFYLGNFMKKYNLVAYIRGSFEGQSKNEITPISEVKFYNFLDKINSLILFKPIQLDLILKNKGLL